MKSSFSSNINSFNKVFTLLVFCLGLALPFKDQYSTIATIILFVCAVIVFIKEKKTD